MNVENHVESEYNRFGLIPILILLVGCLGGIAVGMGAIKDTWALILVVFPTMLTLSLLLAVSPMKWIYKATSFTLVIDLLLIIYYLVQ
jgi:hypothetical protein